MDPTTAVQALGGAGASQPGMGTGPTPQQMLMLQNLMQAPGGLGAMQPQPSQMQPSPGTQGPMQPMPQPQPQNMVPGGMGQPMQNQQQLLQLMGNPSGQ